MEGLVCIGRCRGGNLYWQAPHCHRPSELRRSTERVSPGMSWVSFAKSLHDNLQGLSFSHCDNLMASLLFGRIPVLSFLLNTALRWMEPDLISRWENTFKESLPCSPEQRWAARPGRRPSGWSCCGCPRWWSPPHRWCRHRWDSWWCLQVLQYLIKLLCSSDDFEIKY